ncbi:MAG: hypothetical protein K6G72_02380 [Lachnospiraceae bacterium]|nr:hypothetical protein [Lachnospiraceae bacterium]
MSEFGALLNEYEKYGYADPNNFPFNWERKYWGDKVDQDDFLEDEICLDTPVKDDYRSYKDLEREKKRKRINNTALKKKKRFKRVLFGEYRHDAGWYIKKDRRVCRYEKVHIPKHTEEVTYIAGTKSELRYYDGEKPYYVTVPVFAKEVKTVPARTVKKCVSWEYVPTKPYLKKIGESKKCWKKIAAKRVRKHYIPDGSGYKRVFDLAWQMY